MYRILATLKDSGRVVGFRFIDHTGNKADCDIAKAIELVLAGCENAKVEGKRIVGTECSLDKIPVFNADGTGYGMDNYFILNAITKDNHTVGYRLMDVNGMVATLSKDDALKLAISKRIVNVRVGYNSGGTPYLAGIMKELKRIELQKKDEHRETPSHNSEKESLNAKKREGVKVENQDLKRMQELVPYLRECARVYEQENRELISNYAYDKLYDELKALEEKTGVVLAGSVTQKVGFDVLSKLPKITHEKKMLSLDKTKSVEKLEEFLGNQEGYLSWKLDGLTIVATYDDGKLVGAVTRGNGTIGEGVTENYCNFSNVPLKIDYKGKLVIRGEAIIDYPTFEKINEKLAADAKYKNPRNLCSGSVRQLDSKITAKRNVRFIGFGVVSGLDNLKNKTDKLDAIEKMGFETVDYVKVNKSSVKAAVDKFTAMAEKYKVPVDGLVLMMNDIEYSLSLGETSKFPRDGIAFKWKDEIVETTLLNVEWSTSRTGAINPIAVFEEVDIEGSSIERASLHNVSILEGLQLGIGDRITVFKANMIIPQVAENLTKSNNLQIPDTCPVCGHAAVIQQDKDSKVLMCKNLNCKAQIVRALSHYVSRDAMNIDGMSEATIDTLRKKGFINSTIDIYGLEKYKDDICSMDGWGEKSYEKLVKAIEASKDVELDKFIYALGISQIGRTVSKAICKRYNYKFDDVINASLNDIMQIDGIGDVIAKEYVDYFSDNANKNKAIEIAKLLRFKSPMKVDSTSPIAGKKFVVTGDVTKFANRKELQAFIESKGGINVGSVSKETDYLINNDKTSTSGKNKKAMEVNAKATKPSERVEIINEDDFLNMFN